MLHKDNSFITLTYDDNYLPNPPSLQKEHLQNFFKRLRKSLHNHKIRYYACGEYGDKDTFQGLGRPHYHAIIFGWKFPDRLPWGTSKTGFPIDNSTSLSKLWPYGYATVQNMTIETAQYVARYTMKKITGEKADANYRYTDTTTGETTLRLPEFTTMSLKPGIGAKWFEKFGHTDCYPKDHLTINGVKYGIPKHYDVLMERQTPGYMEKIKENRKIHLEKHKSALTSQRLAQMELCKQLQVDQLLRLGVS
jgi:hypothetical protein